MFQAVPERARFVDAGAFLVTGTGLQFGSAVTLVPAVVLRGFAGGLLEGSGLERGRTGQRILQVVTGEDCLAQFGKGHLVQGMNGLRRRQYHEAVPDARRIAFGC